MLKLTEEDKLNISNITNDLKNLEESGILENVKNTAKILEDSGIKDTVISLEESGILENVKNTAKILEDSGIKDTVISLKESGILDTEIFKPDNKNLPEGFGIVNFDTDPKPFLGVDTLNKTNEMPHTDESIIINISISEENFRNLLDSSDL